MADDKSAQGDTGKSPARSTSGASPTATEPRDSGKGNKGGGQRQESGADLDRRRTMVGVTETGAEEYAALGVNPRLDNRLGDQRPILPRTPKPQQIDGPEVGHFAEHAEQFAGEFEEAVRKIDGEPIGSKSEGPHGRGPHGVTVGDEHGQPQEQMATGTSDSDPRNPA